MPTVFVLSVPGTFPDRDESSIVAVSSAVLAHRILAQTRSTDQDAIPRERAILARPEDISRHDALVRAWGRHVDPVFFDTADLADTAVQRQVWAELCERALYFSPRHAPPTFDSCATPEPA